MQMLIPATSESQRISTDLMNLTGTIHEILSISGVPGVSIGILHHGDIVYEKGFGFRNFEEKLVPNEHTCFVIGSLTKAFTAAVTASLVERRKMDWNSRIQDIIIPDFRPDREEASSSELTITDLLSHRTGLIANDNLWLGSNNHNLLDYRQSLAMLAYAKRIAPVRSQFIYNNFAYDVMSHVIEKVSGKSFSENLRESILVPLSMQRTFYGTSPPDDSNEALPYGVLTDGKKVRLPIPLAGDETLMRAAGGIRSTVHDLLLFYQAFNSAAEKQIVQQKDPDPDDPLKQMRHMWQANMPIIAPSLRMGLKGKVEDLNPIVGETRPSRLAMHHQGSIPGYQSYVSLFPETSSAVVVLSNGLSPTNHVRWLGELLTETLFQNKVDTQRYINIAKEEARRTVSFQMELNEQLKLEGRGKTSCRPIQDYVGKYWNAIHNFFIEIKQQGSKLFVSFQGRDSDCFELFPHIDDQFYWKLTYDEMVTLAREPGKPKQFYIISFASHNNSQTGEGVLDGRPNITQLEWKHDPDMKDQGEVFRRT